MSRLLNSMALLLWVVASTTALAQPPQGFDGPPPGSNGPQPGFGGRRGPGGFPGFGNREERKLVKQFDKDENGWLNQEERVPAREAAKTDSNERRGFGPPGGRRGRNNRPAPEPGPQVSPEEVKQYPDASLYEPNVLRTLFLQFENDDWEQELEDFHGTDVDVPATLSVDGNKYPNVGVHFRGMSSYGMVPAGYKRSFNVSLDLADEDQRLYGYKTLNLLNCSGDPSFMSTVLYSHIADEYIPVPKSNHVQVVVNGESWGIYTNVQQFDKIFVSENFDSSKGTRWKVSGSPGGDGGLRYLGDDLDEYKSRFEMKSNDGKKAWGALINLCRTLNETPLEDLEGELEPLLDIDETLRFLALDVALVNSDGYWTRASDYYLFLDDEKQFHVIPHDMNEAFEGGRGTGRGPGGFGPPPGRGFGPGAFGPPGDDNPGDRSRPQDDADRGGDDRGEPQRPDRQPRDGQPRDERRGDRGPGSFGPPPGGFGPGGFGPGPEGSDRGEGDRQGRGRRGPGGFGFPGGPGHGGPDLDPLVSVDNPRMPLRSQLLSIPHLREKYLGYVREIAEKSLAPENVEPFIEQHARLIAKEVAGDTRKLDSLEAFEKATAVHQSTDDSEGQSLTKFIKERREFLLNYQPPKAGETETN